jgi:hypothetical protein
VEALAGIWRSGLDHGGGLADDPVALLEFSHCPAALCHHAGELLAEDDGIVHLPALLSEELMQIAPQTPSARTS